MIPSDQFVLFYNEIFKCLEKLGPEARQKYYRRVADRQAFFTLDRFKRDGFKGMYDYWERIRLEENCRMRNQHDAEHYESFMERCPSLSKALESETGPCNCYCDHCPGWVNDVIDRAGFIGVYDMIGRRTPRCRYSVYKDRAFAEERYCAWMSESGAEMMRTNMPVGMVHGRLEDSAKFEALHPRFAKVFAWLRTTDLGALAAGRHEIDGDDIYANMMPEAVLEPYAADATMEAHRRYIDIHIPIASSETYGYVYDERGKTDAGFDVTKDFCLFKNPAMRPITVEPGGFVIFFPPGGAHAPNQTLGARLTIKKVVVKVRTNKDIK